MTTEKAIAILRSLQEPEPWEPQITADGFEAIEMAIAALKNEKNLVRCSECKYKDDGIDEDGMPFIKCLSGRSYGGTRINDFCSWGDRKEKK